MKPAPFDQTDKLTDQQSAAAELVATRCRDSGQDSAIVISQLCAGPLKAFCSPWELRVWHRKWMRQQISAAHYQQSPEILVSPEDMARKEAGDDAWSMQAPEEPEAVSAPAGAVEMSGALLRFMDKRLLRAGLRWRESQVALRAGDSVEQRRGAGHERQEDGQVVEWVNLAVLIRSAIGSVRRVVPEAVHNGMRPPGWKRLLHGAVRVKFIAAVRHDTDAKATSQAVGTLLLLFQGNAAGMTTQQEVADMTGCTKANVSAKGIRMARGAKSSTLSTLRCRERRRQEMRVKAS